MEITVFALAVNTLFFLLLSLLCWQRLLGLLGAAYGYIWTITIYLLAIFSPDSMPFLTYKGLGVIYSHILFLTAAAILARSLFTRIHPWRGIKVSSRQFFYLCFIPAAIGIAMIFYTTDVWGYYIQNQLAQLRGDLFEQTITVNRYYKLMANLTYPLAIAAAAYYFQGKNAVWVLVAAVLAGALLSFSNAGKGNLLMVLILLLGGLLYEINLRRRPIPPSLIHVGWGLAIGLILFFFFIAGTRVAENETFSIYDNLVLINEYFSSSIPAFCAWLDQNDIPWIGFDIGQFAILRELGGFIGIESTRTVDHQIVHIPHPFNVFTAFADSHLAFGFLGSLLYYLLLGFLIGMSDVLPKKGSSILAYATFFLFIGYSLFTDIFFYMIGSWICLAFYFLFLVQDDARTKAKPSSA